jgi:hypothetical protein
MKNSELLYLILQAQGELHPGWNSEYLDAYWVRQLIEKFLSENENNKHDLSRQTN